MDQTERNVIANRIIEIRANPAYGSQRTREDLAYEELKKLTWLERTAVLRIINNKPREVV